MKFSLWKKYIPGIYSFYIKLCFFLLGMIQAAVVIENILTERKYFTQYNFVEERYMEVEGNAKALHELMVGAGPQLLFLIICLSMIVPVVLLYQYYVGSKAFT